MKLFGLYEHDHITALEANHRKFSNANGIAYSRYRVTNHYDKLRLIYHLLQENPDETLFFIDSHSYFSTFEFRFSFEHSLLLQRKDGEILHNFIVVRSTLATRSLFKQYILPASSYQYVIRARREFRYPFPPIPSIPENQLIPYPYEENCIHLNLNGFDHADRPSLVRCVQLGHLQYQESFANMLCDYHPGSYPHSDTPFEVINPGCKNAFVTLYTKEIEIMGSISEQNIASYCRQNDITYYVYRRIPENLNHLSGAWCKPYLLLNHINNHNAIAWIDSDILIQGNYRVDFSKEALVFNDHCDWYFNAGFMIYRNIPRNHDLLNEVIRLCDQLDRRDSTHVNGSDQKYFIEAFRRFYPDLLPLSNLHSNTFPGLYPPGSGDLLIHFAGIEIRLRTALMDFYSQKISFLRP